MKLKAKIASTMMSMLLALGVMGFAVWAAATQTLIVNNTVSFVSNHVLASIEGTVTGAVGDNLDADYFGEVNESNDAANKFEAWEIGDISFGNELIPIEIELIITNKSLERFFTFEIDFKNDVIASDNVVRSVAYDATSNEMPVEGATYTEGSKVIVDKNTVATVVVTLSIADTGKSVDSFQNDFSVTLLNLGVASETEEPGETEGFVYNAQDKTLVIPEGKVLTTATIPDAVEQSGSYAVFYTTDDFLSEERITLPYVAEENTTLYAKHYAEHIIDESHFSQNGAASYAINVQPVGINPWENAPEVLVLPSTHNGYPITAINSFAFNGSFSTNVKTLVMPKHLISTTGGMFGGMPGQFMIEQVLFYKDTDTQAIGGGSFQGLTELKSLDLTSLTKMTGKNDATQTDFSSGAFYQNNDLETIYLPESMTNINDGVFSGLSALKNLVIPKTAQIESLGAQFISGTAITSFEVPKNVTVLQGGIFYGPMSLTSLTFEEGSLLEEIQGGAFGGVSITSLEIPKNVTLLRSGALSGLNTLASLTFEEGSLLETLEAYLMSGTSITSFMVPKGIKVLKSGAFSGATNLVNLTFEEGSLLEEIQGGAIMDASITSLVIPKGVRVLESGSLTGVEHLANVTFEAGTLLERIEGSSMTGTAITSFVVPSSVKVLAAGAFANMQLTSLTFELGSQLETIENGVVSGVMTLTNLILPMSVTYVHEAAFAGSGITTITITSDLMKLQQAMDEFDQPIYDEFGPVYELSSNLVDIEYLFADPNAAVTIFYHE